MMQDLKVLYVEDDAIVRENFEEILKGNFSHVITADNGKTALELYDLHKPNVVILDISIPHISGLNVASRIREIDKNVDIIMLTAYSEQDKLLQAVNLQLFAYLIKPVDKKDLDKTIERIQEKYKNESSLLLAHDFKWDKSKKELFYKSKAIKLTNNERLIVSFLCDKQNRYFKACDIAFDVLEENIEDKDCNNVVQLLSRLKHKISKQFDTDDFFIESSYGAGYKIKLND